MTSPREPAWHRIARSTSCWDFARQSWSCIALSRAVHFCSRRIRDLHHRHRLAAPERSAGENAEASRARHHPSGDGRRGDGAGIADRLGFGVVGHWLFENAARLQALYGQTTYWLEGHGIFVTGMLSEYFDVGWLIRAFQQLTGRVHGLVTFALVTLIFLLLGLLEVDTARQKLAGLSNREVGHSLLKACKSIAAKFRRYMLVRTAMSVITGFVIFGFAWIAGLELATAWGVIAFTLNYIPFVGPFVATVLPTLFAIAQSESWEMAVIVFLCLESDPVSDRQLPRAACCRRDPVDLAVHGAVCGVLLDVSVEHPGGVHRRAHIGRGSDHLRAISIDTMDRGAFVRTRGSKRLVSRFRRSYHFAACAFTNVGTKGTLATL